MAGRSLTYAFALLGDCLEKLQLSTRTWLDVLQKHALSSYCFCWRCIL
jgi:hypothetical protein